MGSQILWAIVVGFLAGVFLRSFVPLGFSYALFFIVIAASALACGLLDRGKLKICIVVAVTCTSLGLGIARMNVATRIGNVYLTKLIGKHITLEGTVVAEPDVRDTGIRLSVRVHTMDVGSSTVSVHAGVLVQVSPHTDVSYGDEVHVSGTLGVPKAFDTSLGRQFDYPDYLAVSDILYEVSFTHLDRTGLNTGNVLQAFAIKAKQTFIGGLDAVLPEPEAGLAGGITVGDKRSIGPALSADFQKVSLIHMVVLSGYNITVVVSTVARLLLWTTRSIQMSGGLFVIAFFILMSGGAASATRAGVMAMFAMYARSTGRTFVAIRALAVASVLMIIWNPFTLAFDPSFQLSALATIGLIGLSPICDEYLEWLTERWGLREIVSATLGTQLAVLPLLLYQNGTLSLLSLPANILGLLPVPMSMLASLVAAVGGMLLGSYATPIALPAYALLAYIINVTHFLATLSFASIAVPPFSAWWMLGAYSVLIVSAWTWYKNRTARHTAGLF